VVIFLIPFEKFWFKRNELKADTPTEGWSEANVSEIFICGEEAVFPLLQNVPSLTYY